MRIVVLAKHVPDTWSDRHLDLTTGVIDRHGGEQVPDEISERALEVALRYRDAAEGGEPVEVIALAMGPGEASAMLRKLLAMGADEAVLLSDDALAGADAVRTARVLAAAVRRLGADLVLAGDRSTDGGTAVVPAMIAELTGAAVLPVAESVEIGTSRVEVVSATDGAVVRLSAGYPCVVSVTDQVGEPRLVKFTQIMAAKRKPLQTWTLAELSDQGELTSPAASVMVSAQRRDAKEAGVLVNAADDDAAVQKLADFLSSRRPS
ncbi:MAG: electron transfer flavoprotein subunit beta/FixA family protein [Micrococcaceae bacterium]